MFLLENVYVSLKINRDFTYWRRIRFCCRNIWLLFAYNFYRCDTIMPNLIYRYMYSETGKCLQKIAEMLRNKTWHFHAEHCYIFVIERNLIRADFDHLLGNHSEQWTGIMQSTKKNCWNFKTETWCFCAENGYV